jgi:hypothetical protein
MPGRTACSPNILEAAFDGLFDLHKGNDMYVHIICRRLCLRQSCRGSTTRLDRQRRLLWFRPDVHLIPIRRPQDLDCKNRFPDKKGTAMKLTMCCAAAMLFYIAAGPAPSHAQMYDGPSASKTHCPRKASRCGLTQDPVGNCLPARRRGA